MHSIILYIHSIFNDCNVFCNGNDIEYSTCVYINDIFYSQYLQMFLLLLCQCVSIIIIKYVLLLMTMQYQMQCK